MKSTKNAFKKGRRADIIFCVLMAALPLIHYAIFYVGVNFRSILFAFQEYKSDGLTFTYQFIDGNIFQNFINAYDTLFHDPSMSRSLLNSAIVYFCGVGITLPLSLIFSFFIAKKFVGSKVFRVILFVPSIISIVVLTYIYSIFADRIYPEVMRAFLGGGDDFKLSEYQLLANIDTRFGAILFYYLFFAFGTNVLMYSGAMSGVSVDIIEAAQIDGINEFGELIHIYLPSIFPTITTFLVVGVAGFFTNRFHLVEFYGHNAVSSMWTLGYYLYRNTVLVTNAEAQYPSLSAMGLAFTLIAAPITYLVKYLLEKYGPSEE